MVNSLKALARLVASPVLIWLLIGNSVSAKEYSIEVSADPGTRKLSNYPARFLFDLDGILGRMGENAPCDQYAVKVLDLNQNPGRPARSRVERRDRYYEIAWQVRNERCRRFRIIFSPVNVKPTPAPKYLALLGDGDLFRVDGGYLSVWNFKRFYEVCFVDWNGDGKLDIFFGGPLGRVYYLENISSDPRRPIYRRAVLLREYSTGKPIGFLEKEGFPIWTIAHCRVLDWDGDGRLDLLVGYGNPETMAEPGVAIYRNMAAGPETPERVFEYQGDLDCLAKTRGIWYPPVFLDWYQRGKLDMLTWASTLYDNISDTKALKFSDTPKKVNIDNNNGIGDLDGDGRKDKIVTDQFYPWLFYRNIGTDSDPSFTHGIRLKTTNPDNILVRHYTKKYDYGNQLTGPQLMDWFGSGKLDILIGDSPSMLFENVGDRRNPVFADPIFFRGVDTWVTTVGGQGAPIGVDWDGDGVKDLIIGNVFGSVFFLKNTGSNSDPHFGPHQLLYTGDGPVKVWGADDYCELGYASPEVADWRSNGRPDLFVANSVGWVWYYENTGERDKDGLPVLKKGVRLQAGGQDIDVGDRSNVRAVDFDGDGLLDVLVLSRGTYNRNDTEIEVGREKTHGNYITWFKNIGTPGHPLLDKGRILTTSDGKVLDGTMSVAGFVDWDGDGLKDLLIGWEGELAWYKNLTPGVPTFAPRTTILKGVHQISYSFEDPQVVDWDGDGTPDIICGFGHGGDGVRYLNGDFLKYGGNAVQITSDGVVRDSRGTVVTPLQKNEIVPEFGEVTLDN